jgi:hypothetical protein
MINSLRLILLVQCYFTSLLFAQVISKPREQPILFPTRLSDNCCKYVNDTKQLLPCASETAVFNNHAKSHKFAIVKYSTNNLLEYAAYSMAINTAYAEMNDYEIVLLTPKDGAEYDTNDQRWNKVKILEVALDPVNGWAREMDYVVWIDTDLIFLDMGMKLELVAEEYSSFDMIFSSDPHLENGVVNSGMFMVKNTNWSRSFLSDWWNKYDRNKGMDQHVFTKLYNRNASEISKHIAILRNDAINTNFPSWKNQEPYNQILHLAGVSNIMRAEIFKVGFNNFCNSINDKSRNSGDYKILPNQLGLSRKVQAKIEKSVPRGVVVKQILNEMHSKTNKKLSIKEISNVSDFRFRHITYSSIVLHI